MPAEEDMATVRRFVEEVINRGNLELTDELVTSEDALMRLRAEIEGKR